MGWICLVGSILDDLKPLPDARQEEVLKKKKLTLNIRAVNKIPLQLIISNKKHQIHHFDLQWSKWLRLACNNFYNLRGGGNLSKHNLKH